MCSHIRDHVYLFFDQIVPDLNYRFADLEKFYLGCLCLNSI